MIDAAELSRHKSCCGEAREEYVRALEPDRQSAKWRSDVEEAATSVRKALQATGNLRSVAEALAASGAIVGVLRFFLAPPLSQDQFALACTAWKKTSEKSGRPLPPPTSFAVAEELSRRCDPELRRLAQGRKAEVEKAVVAVSQMMALHKYSTDQRNLAAREQERRVVEVLKEAGWQLGDRPQRGIDRPGLLADRHYLLKVKCATSDGSPHEVDVAVGLPRGRVLAMECKVSNDATNSTKRINDVLKKADAWKKQWGQMMHAGALLQGVYGEQEPGRLLAADVRIFWSHRLDELQVWLLEQA